MKRICSSFYRIFNEAFKLKAEMADEEKIKLLNPIHY